MESLRDPDRDVADDAVSDSGPPDDLFTQSLGHGSLTPHRPIRAGDIANEIRRSYQVSAHDGQEFLPHDKLGKIINESVVRSLLLDLISDDPTMEDADSLTNKIIGEPSRRKIFAVLVIMGKIHFIQDFIKGNITDDDLPLKVKRTTSKTEFSEELYKTNANISDEPHREEHPEPLKSLTSWSFTMKEDFELRQRVSSANHNRAAMEQLEKSESTTHITAQKIMARFKKEEARIISRSKSSMTSRRRRMIKK
ncbi:Cyclin-dependent kinase-like 4 [Colletotrichum sp. SAR 10_66]|nr:Cyclin-dependent kinase-like 4 [Colletotrichum sp. SAR 10_66]